MITSTDNPKLKLIRRLARDKRTRSRDGLFVAEGEDLVEAAAEAGWEPEFVLESGSDIEERLLASATSLASGARVVGVYRERWAPPGADVAVYLDAVADPGNVGTIIRAAHALADAPVALGPRCADPFSPKAVRASMGSIFARPPLRCGFGDLTGFRIALERGAGSPLHAVRPDDHNVIICVGSERDGLSDAVLRAADAVAHVPQRGAGADSLNAAMAATVALYERIRMGDHA